MYHPLYLIFGNGTFQSGLPSPYNDLFEVVQLPGGTVAFRVPNNVSDESPEVVSECYLGFDNFDITSEPKCYNSTDFAAIRFLIIDHDSSGMLT